MKGEKSDQLLTRELRPRSVHHSRFAGYQGEYVL